ncbi:MAG: Gfo/Idh/MocA family oxidoreductase [Armatimonadetes bacterium]|nr:Gfo/Idh/MocA family oxidoreductase [Armatimonadota bacterium]MCX7967825.1 Gfo/Idh/MocA family oxidoreductase [Armatimonadota bacterium]MDW8142768.1 Gfo/Idh/MocA family oxidoreductase [Armatimonadota bacterium]
MLRIGVIGAGDVARKLYLPGIHNPDAGVVLQAVCDLVRERAEAVAKEFNGQSVYTDAATMLEREELDLVFVLTPLLTHPPIVRQVLQFGKHCYSEKPLTLSRREADELMELADQNKVLLLCAPIYPLLPTVQFIRQIIVNGALGKVAFARAHSSHGGPERGTFHTDPGGYFLSEKSGPYVPLYDMGVYALTLLTYVLGSVKRVFAMAGIAIPERRIEKVTEPGFAPYTIKLTTRDNGFVLLDFGDGCFAAVDASFCMRYNRVPSYEFYGSHGSLTADLWRDEIWLVSEVEGFHHPEGWYRLELPDEVKERERKLWGDSRPTMGLRVVEHFRQCLAKGGLSPIHVSRARHVVEVMEKALLALETGKVQEVESRLDG